MGEIVAVGACYPAAGLSAWAQGLHVRSTHCPGGQSRENYCVHYQKEKKKKRKEKKGIT